MEVRTYEVGEQRHQVALYLRKGFQPGSMSSEVFARCALQRHVGRDVSDWVIERTPEGKPYLRDHANIHFNLSHTRGLIVCAVAGVPVGVDAERVRPVREAVMHRFFSKEDRAFVESTDTGKAERFTECWTCMEAYAKWLGTGFKFLWGHDANSIDPGIIQIRFLGGSHYRIALMAGELKSPTLGKEGICV